MKFHFNLIIALITGLLMTSCAFNGAFYHPDTEPVPTPPDSESHYIKYGENDSIHALYYPADKALTSIFILHGNAGSLQGWQSISDLLYQAGYNVFIIDYPGFGNSSGTPSHKNTIASSQAAINYFSNIPHVRATKKVLMGFSLGGNLAIKMATDNPDIFDALLIEGAFDSHRSIAANRIPRPFKASKVFVKNEIDGTELISKWTKPLLIVHSQDDQICPYQMGVNLFKGATETNTKELWKIKGPHLAGINLNFNLYLAKIKKLIEAS